MKYFLWSPHFEKSGFPIVCYINKLGSDSSSVTGVSQTTRTETVGSNSSLQTLSVHSHESSSYVNTQKELQKSPHLQQVSQTHQQKLWQQLPKKKVQQPHVQSSLIQSNIPYGQHHIPPAQPQSFPQSMFTTLQDQPQVAQPQNASILREKLRKGLPNNVLVKQQLQLNQHNIATSYQQPLTEQSSYCGLQQQRMVGSHQHSLHIVQQPVDTLPRQNLEPEQLHQVLGSRYPNNSFEEGIPLRLKFSAM